VNLTLILVAAAAIAFWLMPITEATFSILAAGSVWLLRDAHRRRAAGEAFPAAYRSLLWAAAAFAALLGIVAGVLSALALTDRQGGGLILLIFSVPISLLGFFCAWAYAWYARYDPRGRLADGRAGEEAARERNSGDA
jgi:hypothetical protein